MLPGYEQLRNPALANPIFRDYEDGGSGGNRRRLSRPPIAPLQAHAYPHANVAAGLGAVAMVGMAVVLAVLTVRRNHHLQQQQQQ